MGLYFFFYGYGNSRDLNYRLRRQRKRGIRDGWYGDGISAPGGVTLSYDGAVVYDSGDFGYGEVFRFGDGC